MQMNELRFDDALPVDGYGPGFFRIGGEVVDGALWLCGDQYSGWGGMHDAPALLPLAEMADVILIGTGTTITVIPAELRNALEGAGLGVEQMASPAACRTYNVLVGEGRRVALAVLPVD